MWSGIDVLVGTPGRILDHVTRGNLDLSELRSVGGRSGKGRGGGGGRGNKGVGRGRRETIMGKGEGGEEGCMPS